MITITKVMTVMIMMTMMKVMPRTVMILIAVMINT